MTSNDTFDKRRADAPPHFFDWEATGLRWLADEPADEHQGAQDSGHESVDARDGRPRVVRVVDVRPDGIRLERLTPAPASRAAARAFGAALARLHADGAPGFGCPPPAWERVGLPHGWIGRQKLPLTTSKDAPRSWGAFYATSRLQPYLRAARDLGRFDTGDVAVLERVCSRLEDGRWDDDRPPARIHGDLWGGNVLYEHGSDREPEAVLIDPAAHGGHGETDLAMLALFGTEHLRDVEDAYGAEAGIDRGWRERTGLHQLHPVLVHAVSHGPSYAANAVDIARRYA